jgi:hypothetical protein
VTRSRVTWPRALRALAEACALVLVVTFVAANFVLVDVRLWGLRVETRLAWAAVVPAALGFAAGVLHSRARWAARSAESTRAPGAGDGGGEHPPQDRPGSPDRDG